MGASTKRRLLAVGPMPPAVHGQSVAFETLVTAPALADAFDIEVVNLNTTGMPLPTKIALFGRRLGLHLWHRRNGPPDLLYISFGRSRSAFIRDLPFQLEAMHRGVPIVAHCHGGDFPTFWESAGPVLRNQLKAAFGRYDRLIVLSECFTADWDMLVPSDAIRVVYNCYRLPEGYSLAPPRPRSSDEPLRLLFLSNVLPDKGLFETLRAVGILRRTGSDVRLSVVGRFVDDHQHRADALERRAQQVINEEGIEALVTLNGGLYGRDKWNAYADADVFVLPTYYSAEASPICVIEAMAAGCAVVATEFRGIPDLVREGVDALFVQPRDARDLAAKIRFLEADREGLARMQRAAQKRARESFSADRYVEELIEILCEV